MYHNAYYDRENFKIHIWDDVKGHYTFNYKPYAYIKSKSSSGTMFSVYGDPVKRVQRWSKKDEEAGKVFESDVPILTRVLIDEYKDSDDVSEGHRELIFDIEVSTDGGFPNIENADSEILSIAWYDKAAKEQGVYVYDKLRKYDNQSLSDGTVVEFFQTEEELLSAFYQKWIEIAPTIVSGWNVEGFDIPYLYHRARNVLGPETAVMLSPIRKVLWNDYKQQYKIAGVSILDYLGLYKKFTYTQESSYNLDSIGRKEVNMGKVRYDGTLDKLFETDLMTFIEYNVSDVVIVRKIDEKMDLLNLVKSLSHKAHITYEDVYYSSRVIDGAILMYLKRLGVVAPNRRFRNMEDAEMEGVRSFSGAHVKEPNQGRYLWVYDLDMTSLYPSVIMSLNISPETKVGKISNWDAREYVKGTLATYFLVVNNKQKKLSGEELKEYLEAHDYSVAINGVIYKTKEVGLIPAILDEWFEERMEYRNLMKKYGDSGDKKKYTYFKDRQHVQKILLNSVYGVLGLPTFRFYDSDNAEAVTTTGVSLIQFAEQMANAFYRNTLDDVEEEVDYCIYIDTDSTFFSSEPIIRKRYPDLDMTDDELMSEKTLEVADDVQTYLNKAFKLYAQRFLNLAEHRFHIKQEVIAKAGLWIAKKRYALWIINDQGLVVDKMDVKGLDSVRSNFPLAFRAFLKDSLGLILKNISKADLDEKILAFKKKLLSYPVAEIAKPTSVKGIKKYTDKGHGSMLSKGRLSAFKNTIKGTPAHVKATINYNNFLRYYNLQKKYAPLYESEKIRWAYLKNNPLGLTEIAFRGYEDPPEVIEFIEQYIDRNKIFERELWGKLTDLYDALKWSYPSEADKQLSKFFTF